MVDLSYHHGVRIHEADNAPVIPQYSLRGVTGIIGTAPDANAADYPLNEPTLLLAQRFTASRLGVTGTLPSAIATLIGEGASHIVVVRVDEGLDDKATMSNIIGAQGTRTGAFAFIDSFELLNIHPNVLIAPTFTSDFTDDGIASIVVSNGGTGYTTATATLSDETEDFSATLGDPVIVGGVITEIPIITRGGGYPQAPTVSIVGDGTGAIATANLGDVMNPVVTALNTVAHDRAVVARAWVQGPGTTDVAAVAYRNTINSRRVMVIDPPVLQYDTEAQAHVLRDPTPVFAGVRARAVAQTGVSVSVSNKTCRTITGIARRQPYPDATNYLNERQVSTFARPDGTGWRTWGSRLATSDAIWQFDSVRATQDAFNRDLHTMWLGFVDRRFTDGNVKELLEASLALLRQYIAAGHVLGGRVSVNRELSTPEDMANGRIWIDVVMEPTGIMEDIRGITHREPLYYSVLLDSIAGLIEEAHLSTVAEAA